MIRRRFELPRASFFLLGPRGTGKSTLLRALLPEATLVDLLEEERYQTYLVDPSRFAAELRGTAPGSWVVVDEIQRLVSLLNEIHRAIEGQRLKFALTGSSARKLRRGGTNLLGGRARVLNLFPFVPEELGAAFSLDRALSLGTLPLVWSSEEPRQTLVAYAQAYLKEEIQAEATVRNLPGFARFLPIAALMHGQVMNVAALARDAGVARQTVAGYLQILQDTLLAQLLPAYEARIRVRERQHPKLYFFDPGVVRALKRQVGPLSVEERGPLFEGLCFMLLRFYGEHTGLFDEIGYFAPREARFTEVDFVLSRGKEKVAIEVKTTRNIRPNDLRGLRAIGSLDGLVRRILVFLGPRREVTPDGIVAWPFSEFLDNLRAKTLWP